MNKDPYIAIVDYGVGNLYSLVRAFKHFGANIIVTEDKKTLKESSGIVLPGVGSFEAGMRGLEARDLKNTIQEISKDNKPMLGICLGAQLMMTEGHEFGVFQGLDIIKGKVVHFPPLADKEKIPHVGWNSIFASHKNTWRGSILESFEENDSKNHFYFVHSYILEPESQDNVFALTNYGDYTFCSVIRKQNIYGCQFHPEKSSSLGLTIIKNFINISTT